MPDATIDAVDLTKRFGSRTAVDGLTFTARPGEVLGLLGPNGAGKTTTIRLLTTILAPTAGHFSIAGIPDTEPASIRALIGVLPESAGYPGQQTGRTYLRYYARLFGRSRPDAARLADRLLDEVGLGERAGSRIAGYSRGMRQRLGIARALVNDPVVVFLDEPTLGLDPAGQRQVLDLVREVAERRGATVVLSTHTLPDVEEVCSTVLILMRGRVLDAGSVSAVSALAAAPRSAQLRVPVELMRRARHAITDGAGLRVEGVEGRPDLLRVSVTAGEGASDAELSAALRAVLAAGVPVLGYEVDGGRLNDAFLAMTKEASR
jgi:ABC-2 type transport system ATP-binding protein